MNARITISAVLIISGVILASIGLPDDNTLILKPEKVLELSLDTTRCLTPDQVAGMVVNSDTTMQLIDLRTEDEFRKFSIPGSVNIPYGTLLSGNIRDLLPPDEIKKIFYSNGDYNPNFAFVLAAGMGVENSYVMKGGLNEWFKTIMKSEFKGEKISARENALYETRFRARRLFTEINSLPDSLKSTMLKTKKFDPKKLDGGCE